ncbi:hypothetical protein PFISCL1PPCAC_16973, partial [Pristionchus fissidentatus]
IVDVEEEKLKECYLVAIHRGKLIFSNYILNDGTAIKLSTNIIVLGCYFNRIFGNDNSPLLYFCQQLCNSCSLFVL